MSKLTLTEAVKVIPVSESTLRRDLKNGKSRLRLTRSGSKQIDAPELTRVDRQMIGSFPSWFWSGIRR